MSDTPMAEYLVAAEWLYATLHGDTALMATVTDVTEHPGPQNATFPLVTFALHTATDVSEVAEHRIWAQLLMLVTVTGQGPSTLPLKPAALRLDALLHRTSGATADGQVISSVRREEFYAPDLYEGIQYRRIGGIYELLVQPLNP